MTALHFDHQPTGSSPASFSPDLGARRAYFDGLYEEKDPYGTRNRWYEQRKRHILLSALPRASFESAFEPACGTGELTRELAGRCDHVLASDFCDAALAQARQRLHRCDNVSIDCHQIPLQWPEGEGPFDLIVVSEVCSFLDAEEIRAVALRCGTSLGDKGVLVVCDWRWPFDARVIRAEAAHEIFDRAGLHRLVRHEEDDFLLSLWSVSPDSVARRETLV